MFIDFVLTIVVLILILGFLVFVHELGHFLASKFIGVEVEEFAFGFGRKLIAKKYGDTLYRINLIPLGGYVKVLGDEDPSSFKSVKAEKYSEADIKRYSQEIKELGAKPGDSLISQLDRVQNAQLSTDKKQELTRFIRKYLVPNDPDNMVYKGFWQKMLVYVAGVAMNMLVAFVIFWLFLAVSNYKTDIVKIADYPFVGVEDRVVSRPIIGNVYNRNLVDKGFDVTEENLGILLLEIDENVINDEDDFAKIWNEIEGKEVDVKYLFLNDGKVKESELLLNSAGIDLNIEPEISGSILISSVNEGQPAEVSGIEKRDVVLSLNDRELDLKSSQEFIDILEENSGEVVELSILKEDGRIEDITVDLNSKNKDELIFGASFQLNSGVFVEQYHLDYSENKPFAGVFHSINILGYNPVALFEIISLSFEQGDVELASQSVTSVWGIGEHLNTLVVARDYKSILNMVGLVSVALAFMNILPIPLLDGGQVLFLVIEKLRGKPLSAEVEEKIAKYAFVFLISLSMLVIAKDIWLGFVGDFFRDLF